MTTFTEVKDYLTDLGYAIKHEEAHEELVIIDDEANGIRDLVIDCEYPLLIFEQLILEFKTDRPEAYKRLLQLNRELLHGAFVLDDSGQKLLFRDTLALENLDQNEVESTLNALRIAMAEHARELIEFSK